MEQMKKEIEKMKDQIKTLKTSLLILSITFLVVSICWWIRYFQVQQSLSFVIYERILSYREIKFNICNR